MVGYSHLFKNFAQFIVINTVKGFHIVDKAEIYVFLALLRRATPGLRLGAVAERSYPRPEVRSSG